MKRLILIALCCLFILQPAISFAAEGAFEMTPTQKEMGQVLEQSNKKGILGWEWDSDSESLVLTAGAVFIIVGGVSWWFGHMGLVEKIPADYLKYYTMRDLARIRAMEASETIAIEVEQGIAKRAQMIGEIESSFLVRNGRLLTNAGLGLVVAGISVVAIELFVCDSIPEFEKVEAEPWMIIKYAPMVAEQMMNDHPKTKQAVEGFIAVMKIAANLPDEKIKELKKEYDDQLKAKIESAPLGEIEIMQTDVTSVKPATFYYQQ